MQYFVIERFLFRPTQSEYTDRFVLKGALMFTVWGSPQSRATRDIDLLARSENSVDAMSGMIKEVCRQTVESDGVEFLSDSVHAAIIKENAEYSEVRVTFVAMIQIARLPMQIDIGFGDAIPARPTSIFSTFVIVDWKLGGSSQRFSSGVTSLSWSRNRGCPSSRFNAISQSQKTLA